MKLIYVASPYAGDVERNIRFAKQACRHVMEQGHAFFAPHLLYPKLLDDTNPLERQAGLDMGLAIIPRCDELWCYGSRVSLGMHFEIEEAIRLGIPVRRVREQNDVFIIGKPKQIIMAEASTPSMQMA